MNIITNPKAVLTTHLIYDWHVFRL